jgi:amino acid permease
MGDGIIVGAAAFGFLAVATSYFVLALNLRSTFEYDYRMHKFPSWFLACCVPLGLLLLGVNNFIGIISFTGAVFGGSAAIIVSLLYISVTRKGLLKKRALGVPLFWAYLSIVVLAVGVIYEVVRSVV